MRKGFFYKTRGAISVFLALLTLPFFTFAGVILDGVRLESAKSAVSGAGDLAMNSALSEYDRTLLNVYGLFAMSKTPEELSENLSRYFYNTLSSTQTLESSDSYTRNFLNSLATTFSNPNPDTFNNLLDIQGETFKAKGVPGSDLAQPAVMKRQIVEYMKYRGPVSLGIGFMEKLNILGDTAKQNKAVAAKVEYEKTLDTIQDACEEAYNILKEIPKDPQERISTGSSLPKEPEALGAYLQGKLDEMKSFMRDGAAYEIAFRGLKTSLNPLDSSTPPPFKLDSYEYEEPEVSEPEELTVGDTREDYRTQRDRFNRSYGALGIPSTWSTDIASIDGAKIVKFAKWHKDNEELLRDTYEATRLFLIARENEPAETEEEEEEVEEAEQLIRLLEDGLGDSLGQTLPLLQDKAEDFYDKANEIVYQLQKWTKETETQYDDAIADLKDILNKVDELAAKGQSWSSANSALMDGDIKVNMQQDYKNQAEKLKPETVEKMIEEMEKGKAYFAGLQGLVSNITFYRSAMTYDSGSGLSLQNGNVSFHNYEGHLPVLVIGDFNGAISAADVALQNSLVCPPLSSLVPLVCIVPDETKPEQEFYKYLAIICQKAKASDAAKDKAEEEKDFATDKAKEKPTPENIAEGIIPGLDPNDFKLEELGTEDSDIADNAVSNMNTTAQSLSGIDSLLKAGEGLRDKMYLMEYMTTMFSYYTVDKDKGGNVKPAEQVVTLSNVPISAANNKFYKAEVEYLLWGMEDPSSNVNATMAMIFGIRFLLNAVYAFTNAEINNYTLAAATAIAGWTGFGVPIVQTVLKLALAAGESALDLKQLSEGKAVALYKNRNTWVLSPGGLLREGREQIAQDLERVAQQAVENFFDKMRGFATGKIEDAEEAINSFVNETQDSLVQGAVGAIMGPLDSLALTIITSAENITGGEDTASIVSAKIDAYFSEMRATIEGGNEAEGTKKAKLAALDYLVSSAKEDITEEILSARERFISGTTTEVDAIRDSLKTTLDRITDEALQEVQIAIADMGKEFKEDVIAALDEAEEGTQKKVEDLTNEYLAKLNGLPGSEGTSKKTSVSSGGGFTMNYEEYLKLFVLLALAPSEEVMLRRTGNLIECNLNNGSGYFLAEDSRYKKNGTFELSKAYTMVGIEATVQVRTSFWGIMGVQNRYNGSTGRSEQFFDYSQIGSQWQTMVYQGVSSY